MNSDNLLHASRAEQRRQRLLDAERELAAEEADALTLTEEQRQTLLRPFVAVKAEFADLDGLRWTQTALLRRQPSQRRPPAPTYHDHDPSTSASPDTSKKAFAVLTNTDLAPFAPDDTIRVSSQPTRNRPRFPSPLIRGTTSLPGTSSTDPSNHHPRPPTGHRDGTHTRSPVKGLFSHDPDADEAEWTPHQVYLDDMDPASHYFRDDGYILRPPPPGLTQAPMYHSAAAESSTRRTHAAMLLESPAEPFSSSLLDPPPPSSPRSLSVYYSSSSKSTFTTKSATHLHSSLRSTQFTNELTLRPLSRTSSTLSILTSPSPNSPPTHHLPRRQASKHGVPRPTRHAPSPPSPPPHLTGDADDADDEGLSSLLHPPPSLSSPSLLDPPPRRASSSSLLPHTTRPISRSASLYFPPTSELRPHPHTSSPTSPNSHPTNGPHSKHTAPPHTTHPSPRARLASLLAHTPSPSASSIPSPAPPPPLLRTRSSSASASTPAHPVPDAPPKKRIRPPGLRGWTADVQAPVPVQVQIHGDGGAGAGMGAGGGGYASEEDSEWDAEETPRASPVETPGGSPSRGWIRGFA